MIYPIIFGVCWCVLGLSSYCLFERWMRLLYSSSRTRNIDTFMIFVLTISGPCSLLAVMIAYFISIRDNINERFMESL